MNYMRFIVATFFIVHMSSTLSTELFSPNGTPHKTLVTLLNSFQISAQTPAQIVKETQEKWLRTAGKERWESEDPYAPRKQELMPLFENINVVHEIKPTQQEYDYVLVMGALFARSKSRLEYAIDLWKQGYRFKEIIILGSERPLNATLEPASLFGQTVPVPTNQYEMMVWLYHNTPMPEEMRACKVTFINAPNTIDDKGNLKRAATEDTLIEWLTLNPLPGSVLMISNQPHVEFQYAVTRNYIPESFFIDAAGEVMSPNTRMTDILDALARWIYQEEKLYNKAHHA